MRCRDPRPLIRCLGIDPRRKEIERAAVAFSFLARANAEGISFFAAGDRHRRLGRTSDVTAPPPGLLPDGSATWRWLSCQPGFSIVSVNSHLASLTAASAPTS